MLIAAEATSMQGAFFDTTISVYTDTGPSGAFDQLVQSSLSARFKLVPSQGNTATDRDELAARRVLYWVPSYVMPEHAQVQDADGLRWQPIPGTFKALGRGVLTWRRCDVVRVSEVP